MTTINQGASSGELLALAERVEALVLSPLPGKALDQQRGILTEAFIALHGPIPGIRTEGSFARRFERLLNAGGFLDAAILLVPEGHSWRCGFGIAGWAAVHKGQIPNYRSDPIAATAALALCAAALKARAAQGDAPCR